MEARKVCSQSKQKPALSTYATIPAEDILFLASLGILRPLDLFYCNPIRCAGDLPPRISTVPSVLRCFQIRPFCCHGYQLLYSRRHNIRTFLVLDIRLPPFERQNGCVHDPRGVVFSVCNQRSLFLLVSFTS